MEPSHLPFAFRLAEVREDVQADATHTARWEAREDVAVAGCTGLFARASRYPNQDNGIYC